MFSLIHDIFVSFTGCLAPDHSVLFLKEAATFTSRNTVVHKTTLLPRSGLWSHSETRPRFGFLKTAYLLHIPDGPSGKKACCFGAKVCQGGGATMFLGNLTKRGSSLIRQLKSGSAQNFPSSLLHPEATAAGWLLRFESSVPAASAPSAAVQQQQQYANPSKSGLLVDTLEMVRRDANASYTMM